MPRAHNDVLQGLEALRAAVSRALTGNPTGNLVAVTCGLPAPRPERPALRGWLLSEASPDTTLAGGPDRGPAGGSDGGRDSGRGSGTGPGFGDAELASSSEGSEAERTRLIALVELARTGDSEAFGMLFDHYHPSVYRFLYYRTHSVAVAEDLTSETFVRALRNMAGFRWQGKDFGAWLMTIARNLATDHFKAGRTRLEMATEDMGAHDSATEGPETAVLSTLTNQILLRALTELPPEQKDCLVMRFLQGLSIAETAEILGRSEGAVKQLQLRGVRNLAKLVPEGIR